MSYNNNNNKGQEMMTLVSWNSSSKASIHRLEELRALRKPAPESGTGSVYYNFPSDRFERIAAINFVPRSKIESLVTRSASIAAQVIRRIRP